MFSLAGRTLVRSCTLVLLEKIQLSEACKHKHTGNTTCKHTQILSNKHTVDYVLLIQMLACCDLCRTSLAFNTLTLGCIDSDVLLHSVFWFLSIVLLLCDWLLFEMGNH